MITFMESKDMTKETEKCLDPQLWHACAGSMVQMPSINSDVFYFPQGHSEHASGNVDFRNCPRISAYVRCRVSDVKFMAHPETDEVFAKIHLVPLSKNEVHEVDDCGPMGLMNTSEIQEKPTSFAKTLTQSDANNGGGFSVPRYCAETIFPRLDYSSDPPVQTILAKDVHGETWKFRHIYRGTPRRHLLTTGWSTFVNRKKLVAGDSIVFLRTENGDLCVGIRRAKRGIGDGPDAPIGWNHPSGRGNGIIPYGGLSAFLREDDGGFARNGNRGSIMNDSLAGRGRVKTEDVIEAATLAASGESFDVIYYPRASTPEFCVKASLVKAAMQIRWCSGMRFKMAFETEDSSRISWFMGTISSVQVCDPIRWPDSLWRLLQVTWDEPDLLQNVKRVNPWLVELVSNMPAIHMSPFSPPCKKLRLSSQHHPEFPLDGQIPYPSFSATHHHLNHPFFGCLNLDNNNNNTPAGMQGARHARCGFSSSISDHLHRTKLHSSAFFPLGFPSLNQVSIPNLVLSKPGQENHSCLLTIGSSTNSTQKKSDKAAPFVLFGQAIHTEEQITLSNRNSSPNENGSGSSSAANRNGDPEREGFQSGQSLETDHCKVFMESEDVGRTLDLSSLCSYEELNGKLAKMFEIEVSQLLNHVHYRDATGAVRQLGDEPFSSFRKTAKRLTIQGDSSSDNVGS